MAAAKDVVMGDSFSDLLCKTISRDDDPRSPSSWRGVLSNSFLNRFTLWLQLPNT
jgi:hypothetical protein